MLIPSLLKDLIRSQWKFFFWVFLVLVIASVWGFLERDSLQDYFQALEKRNQEKEKLAELDRQVKALDHEKEVLSSKEDFELEKVVRERQRLSKKGEKVLYIKDPRDPDAPTSGSFGD